MSKIKWAALSILVLSLLSLLLHLLLAKYSTVHRIDYTAITAFPKDFHRHSTQYTKLWGNVKPLESLQPYANPRIDYPVPDEHNNGFIYAKVFGGFENIRSSICDLVAISRLLNATLVIPEIQESTRSKGISSKFKSFSYLYNEDQFIAALTKDVIIVKSLPKGLKDRRKKNIFPTFKPKRSSSPSFYLSEVLPKMKKEKVVGLIVSAGGCLQSLLPPSFAEYQRLRCRVAFHALQFRLEIQVLGRRMVERLKAWNQPYIAFHPGLMRDSLAYHGCAELFQDIHTELIQYRRAQMIKKGIIKDELKIDSHLQRLNGSCPLMPEEVGLLLRALGYPPKTIIYLAGSEIFGGQRILIPLRAMYTNSVDRTSLCSKKELWDLINSETPLPQITVLSSPSKSNEQLQLEWKKAGPRPRPLPPPPDRPIYRHEKEGWYGWIAETDTEPDPSPLDMRNKAHRLIWDALDYIVSVEAGAFFPGFHNAAGGLPDFSSLVMGHRLYDMAYARTYRPDRKLLAELFNSTQDHMYYPGRNWTISVREHLNKSLEAEGLIREALHSKPTSFLSHPLPECACRTPETTDVLNAVKDANNRLLYGDEDECPKWMQGGLGAVSLRSKPSKDEPTNVNENDSSEDDMDMYLESDDSGTKVDATTPADQDDEMDPDD